MSCRCREVPGPTRTSRWTPMVACAGRCPGRARHLQDIAWNVGCPSGLGDVPFECQAPPGHRSLAPPGHDHLCRYRIRRAERPPLPRLRRPLTETFVDLGARRSRTATWSPTPRPDGAPLPAPRARLRRVSARPAAGRQTAEAIFSDYAYFSSYSTSWLDHARALRRGDRPVSASGAARWSSRSPQRRLPAPELRRGRHPGARRRAGRERRRGGRRRGVATEVAFFGRDCAEEARRRGGHADLIVANNVLAHVPDLNDFLAGIAALLAPGGRGHDRGSRTCST